MRVGVEVGGTFTDLVAVEDGRIVLIKVPSTPQSPDIGINNTQTIKPGVKMPELGMLASEIDGVTSYLEGLK